MLTLSDRLFHIDIAEVQTAEGKPRLFAGVDRISKLAYAELPQEAGKMIAAQFMRDLITAVAYAIHTALTDNVLCAGAAARVGEQATNTGE